MPRSSWKIVIFLALAIGAFVLGGALSTASADVWPPIQVTMTSEPGADGSSVLFKIWVKNVSSSDFASGAEINGLVPAGTKFLEAWFENPQNIEKGKMNGFDGTSASFVTKKTIGAGKTGGPYAFRVSTAGVTGSITTHAWVGWGPNSVNQAVSDDLTVNVSGAPTTAAPATTAPAASTTAAPAATATPTPEAPRRGCLACHTLADPKTGKYTLAYEAEERAQADYKADHPNMAPDGTSMKVTDQNNVQTCLLCHKPSPSAPEKGVGAPITLRDIVHPAHMFSTTFKEHYNGNCFTCHDVAGDGDFNLLNDKVDVNDKGVPKALEAGKGAIPGEIEPSEDSK